MNKNKKLNETLANSSIGGAFFPDSNASGGVGRLNPYNGQGKVYTGGVGKPWAISGNEGIYGNGKSDFDVELEQDEEQDEQQDEYELLNISFKNMTNPNGQNNLDAYSLSVSPRYNRKNTDPNTLANLGSSIAAVIASGKDMGDNILIEYIRECLLNEFSTMGGQTYLGMKGHKKLYKPDTANTSNLGRMSSKSAGFDHKGYVKNTPVDNDLKPYSSFLEKPPAGYEGFSSETRHDDVDWCEEFGNDDETTFDLLFKSINEK